MKNVRILDCTLRDGGRIINCEFKDVAIAAIAKGLNTAGVDIIEMVGRPHPSKGQCVTSGYSFYRFSFHCVGYFS